MHCGRSGASPNLAKRKTRKTEKQPRGRDLNHKHPYTSPIPTRKRSAPREEVNNAEEGPQTKNTAQPAEAPHTSSAHAANSTATPFFPSLLSTPGRQHWENTRAPPATLSTENWLAHRRNSSPAPAAPHVIRRPPLGPPLPPAPPPPTARSTS